MRECVLLDSCWFYNELLPQYPSEYDHMKKDYCMNCYFECARYQLSRMLGRDKIPVGLFPND
jgi:hypothetical protein